MKRLIEIANIEEATLCFQQQNSYKCEVKALSDYNKSLDNYKTFVKNLKTKTLKYCEDINSIFVFKRQKTKKRSIIDYYTIMLQNLMEHFADQTKKVVDVLELSYVQAKEFLKKSEKLIADSEKMMQQQIIYHQNMFKDYMLNVYPETDSIFFRLRGNDKKYMKKENPSKEAALVQQFRAYQEILNCEIDKMNENIRQMTDIFKDKTEEIKVSFVKCFEDCLPQFEGEFRQEELQSFVLKIETMIKEKENKGRSKSKPKTKERDYF